MWKASIFSSSTLISIIIDKGATESCGKRVGIWESAVSVQISSQYDFYWGIIRIKQLDGSGYLVYVARLRYSAILVPHWAPFHSRRFPAAEAAAEISGPGPSAHSDIGNAIFIRFLGARISSPVEICVFSMNLFSTGALFTRRENLLVEATCIRGLSGAGLNEKADPADTGVKKGR